MEGIADFAPEPAAIYAMVGFEVSDHRFDGGTTFEPNAYWLGQGFPFSPMVNGHFRVVRFDAVVT
jgi:hypothetical protein